MKKEYGPLLPGTKQVVLAFYKDGAYDRNGHTTLVTHIDRTFLPKGLVVWGATDETLVHSIKVGNQTELAASGYAPIPGHYFTQDRSFDDLARLAAVGEIECALPLRLLTELAIAEIGNQISVSVSGPFDNLCLWGTTYSDGHPYRRASIEKLESGGFVGRIDQVGLRGVDTVFEASAPEAELVARLLVGFRSQQPMFG